MITRPQKKPYAIPHYIRPLVVRVISVSLVILNAGTAFAGAKTAKKQLHNKQPIQYRCDAMTLLQKPQRLRCTANVVVKRGDITLCCNLFHATQGADNTWQNFVCEGDVRAQRNLEQVWAGKATFITKSANLILTEHPQLRRGNSLLFGEKIVIDTHRSQLQVIKPRGVVVPLKESQITSTITTTHTSTVSTSATAASTTSTVLRSPPLPTSLPTSLPTTCPLPPPPHAKPHK